MVVRPQKSLSLVTRAWRQLGRRRKVQLALLVVLMFVAAVVEVFSIGAVVPFLAVLSSPERAFEHPLLQPLSAFLGATEPGELVLPVTVIFALGAIASGVFRYLLLRAQTRVTYSIGVDFSVRIFERTLYQPYLVHVNRNSSEVIAGVSNKANDLIVSLLYPVAIMVSSTIMLTIVLSALAAIEPLITFSTIAAFTLFYWFTSVLSKRQLGDSSRIISRQYSNVIRLIQEGLGGIRDILLDGTQRTFVDNYRASETELRDSRATVQIMSGTPRYVIETLGILFIAALAYSLSAGTAGLSGAVPVLGVVALAAQRLIPVMQQLYSSWASIVGGSASVQDALALLEQPVPEPERGAPGQKLSFESELRLQEVSFQYVPDLPPVLRNVNLTVPKGARLGIVGETGSGKSTFLDVVMGLIAPTSGAVLVDGRRLDTANLRAWQLNIAHVPQSIYLADCSIAENIAFGQLPADIDMDRVAAAATTARILDVIEALPHGFRTMVGERGVKLSGGQRQRIGIARAIYKQANVIVLDEATSALDTDTERAVMNAIHELPGRITLLIVAHRHSTLRDCSSVIRIRDGIVEYVDNFSESFAGGSGRTHYL
jgi:ATP-binding cassette, subfamily B, bacterial PglK